MELAVLENGCRTGPGWFMVRYRASITVVAVLKLDSDTAAEGTPLCFYRLGPGKGSKNSSLWGRACLAIELVI